jgi:hypothetical protein
MTRAKLALGLAASLVCPPLRAATPAADPDLLKGEEQVRAGAYEAGIVTLTSVVRRLGGMGGEEKEVAQAYLHLGIAYAALGQMSPARSQFVQALERDPSLTLDPKTTPAAALEAFAAAHRESESEGVLSAKARKGKKGPLILMAAGAVGAGVGLAVAASGDSSSIPPAEPFVPISTSPYLELVNASPGPGSLASDRTVSLTVRARNVGSTDLRFFLVAEALTGEGRVCLAGQAGPFSFGPGSTVLGTFVLRPVCAPPFTTETLVVAIQDPETGARPYRASYRGSYQVTQ